jgi:hypothetical protein
MDIGQRWNEAHATIANPAHGSRRRRLLEAVADIRTICEAQFGSPEPGATAPVDQPAVPEILQSPDQRNDQQLHEALKAARNLLYVDLWELFSAEMQCRLEDIAGGRGEVFANFRGLVMSTDGLDTTVPPVYQPKGQATASVGTATFANFSRDERFQADGAEANAVVKAFWPFVRRITPRSDYREFVACGVLGWRAIYVTALGSSSQYTERHERNPSAIEEGEYSIRVRPDLLPGNEKPFAAPSEAGHFDSLVRSRMGRSGNNHPVRYLLLTKHEPHPRQIGRIAERINTMGTMRLYALKDWTAIRNADPYIRILGQELDQITENWGSNRRLINELRTLKQVRALKEEIRRLAREGVGFLPGEGTPTWTRERLEPLKDALPGYTPRSPMNPLVRLFWRIRFFYNWSRYGELMRGMENDAVADIRHSALYEISNKVETDLIDISAKLDKMGFGATGGLHFRLNRSAYHVKEFQILLKTLQVGNIPTWVSYEQFVRRGLAPAFDYMASVGKRLRAVRARLLTITETIETSALVGQSAATRHNTAVLRQTTALAIVFLVIYLARTQLMKAAVAAWVFIRGRLPAAFLSFVDQFAAWFQ